MKQYCLVFAFVVGITLCGAAAVNKQCANRPEGYVVEITGCFKAKICENGTLTNLTCSNNTVLEKDSMTCIPIGTGNTACGTIHDCTGKNDGLYADTNCQSYVWCINGAFLPTSRNYCNADLLFNDALQLCDFNWNIPPPCGTLIVETPPKTIKETSQPPTARNES